MFAVFRISKGTNEGRTFSLMEGHELVIGRGDDAGAKLVDNNVAEKQCKAEMKQGEVILSVLDKSRNTVVNGQPAQATQTLNEGDVLQVGSTLLTFEFSRLDEQATLMMDE